MLILLPLRRDGEMTNAAIRDFCKGEARRCVSMSGVIKRLTKYKHRGDEKQSRFQVTELIQVTSRLFDPLTSNFI